MCGHATLSWQSCAGIFIISYAEGVKVVAPAPGARPLSCMAADFAGCAQPLYNLFSFKKKWILINVSDAQNSFNPFMPYIANLHNLIKYSTYI